MFINYFVFTAVQQIYSTLRYQLQLQISIDVLIKKSSAFENVVMVVHNFKCRSILVKLFIAINKQ